MQKIDLFVPGRLCLFGEHSDWAGKYRSMNSALVSGFSQNTIKMLLSEKNSPWDILKDTLDSERYARITVIAKGGQNS